MLLDWPQPLSRALELATGFHLTPDQFATTGTGVVLHTTEEDTLTDPKLYRPLDHLCDEIAYLHARARRILAEREAKADAPARTLRVVGGAKPATCCVVRHAEEEALLRSNTDNLLEARRVDENSLPLDKLCEDHDLGLPERMAILLAVLPCVGVEAAELLGEIGPCGFAIGSPSPEIVARMLELDLRGQMELRRTFAPGSPLMRSGLVELDVGRDPMPDDFPTAAIRLTPKAFTLLTGMPVGYEEPAAT